jgi:hypothetical protein
MDGTQHIGSREYFNTKAEAFDYQRRDEEMNPSDEEMNPSEGSLCLSSRKLRKVVLFRKEVLFNLLLIFFLPVFLNEVAIIGTAGKINIS